MTKIAMFNYLEQYHELQGEIHRAIQEVPLGFVVSMKSDQS